MTRQSLSRKAPRRALPEETVRVPAPRTFFSPAALAFLRALARNNRREWFEERRATYEAELRQPMLAILARITAAMADFAPAHVRPPEKSLLRIYRDIRFSPDKRPYKNQVAAWWTREGLPKTSGAGYYFHVSGKEVQIAAGVYMPPKEQLLAIRRNLLDTHEDYRRALRSATARGLFEPETGVPLTRVPKGFPREHPADDLLRQRQWGVSATLDAESATDRGFADEVIRRFRAARVVVDHLNTPLIATARPRRRPLFALPAR